MSLFKKSFPSQKFLTRKYLICAALFVVIFSISHWGWGGFDFFQYLTKSEIKIFNNNFDSLQRNLYKSPRKIFDTNEDFYSPGKLKEILRSENIDQIYKALNKVKMMNYKGEILPLIKDLWDVNLKNHPTISAKLLTKPIIRLNLADILIQAHNNREIEVDTSNLHEYVSSLLFHSYRDVVFDAILILPSFNKRVDIEKFVKIAEENNELFKICMFSLGNICDPLAEEKLKKLYEDYNNVEARRIIKKAIDNRKKEYFKYKCNKTIKKY